MNGGTMRRAIVMAVAAAVLACSDSGPSAERFFAVLSSQSEVPPAVSGGAGTANFTVNGSGIDYSVILQTLVGVSAIQLDSGAAGDVGPVLASLYSGPTTGTISTAAFTGTLTSAAVSVPIDSLLAWMRRSKVYVNVLTTGQPAGELRGQVAPQ